jgi:murein DD-endopeptidase MepM/ murein hydrolase activator NlpD
MAKESRALEIFRKELEKNGILKSFLSSKKERIKETLDPRNLLLPQTGYTGAIARKFFGKPYRYGGYNVRNVGGGATGQISEVKPLVEKISSMDIGIKIIAKNTMALPNMSRDMNVMRQNVQKLVKISGGKPSTKADAFFAKSNEREALYENQFLREREKGSKKENKKPDEQSSSSIFSNILSGLGNVGGGIIGILGSLLGSSLKLLFNVGGGLLSLGGTLISSMLGIIGSAGGAIFRVIGGSLMGLGPIGLILSGVIGYLIYSFSKSIDFDELGKSFKETINKIGDSLKDFFGIKEGQSLKTIAEQFAEKLDKFFGTTKFSDTLHFMEDTFAKMYNAILDFTIEAKVRFEIFSEKAIEIFESIKNSILIGLGIQAGTSLVRGAGAAVGAARAANAAGAGATVAAGAAGAVAARAAGAAASLDSATRDARINAMIKTKMGAAFANAGAAAAAGSKELGNGAKTTLAVIGKLIGGRALTMLGSAASGPTGWIIDVALAGYTLYEIVDILNSNNVELKDLEELKNAGYISEQQYSDFKTVIKSEEDIKFYEKRIIELSRGTLANTQHHIDLRESYGEKLKDELLKRDEALQRLKISTENPKVSPEDVYNARVAEAKRQARYMNIPDRTSTSSTSPTSYKISSQFGESREGHKHQGIDIAMGENTPISSYTDGIVSNIDESGKGNAGKYIEVTDENGNKIQYMHLNSIDVRKGDSISTGQIIGKSGNTGHSTGPHLHVQALDEQGKIINPNELFKQYISGSSIALATPTPTNIASKPKTTVPDEKEITLAEQIVNPIFDMIDAVLGLNKPQTQETTSNNVTPNNTNQPIVQASQARNERMWEWLEKIYATA